MSRWIDADIYVTANLYDDEHEEYRNERITIADCLDRFTDEGCPTEGKPKQQWIPVSERLPEPRKAVLAYAPHFHNVWAVWLSDSGKWMVWAPGMPKEYEEVWCGELVAWMPLPEPYTEV